MLRLHTGAVQTPSVCTESRLWGEKKNLPLAFSLARCCLPPELELNRPSTSHPTDTDLPANMLMAQRGHRVPPVPTRSVWFETRTERLIHWTGTKKQVGLFFGLAHVKHFFRQLEIENLFGEKTNNNLGRLNGASKWRNRTDGSGR